MESITLLGVFLAGIAAMAVGALWFAPVLFGNVWMKAGGFDGAALEREKKKGMMPSYIGSFIGWLVTFFVLSYGMSLLGVTRLSDALITVFLVWIGFVLPTLLHGVLWEYRYARRSTFLVVNAAHYLVALLAGVLILSFFL